MSSVLEIENNIQKDLSANRRTEIPEERATRTGFVCICCAIIAVFFAFSASMLFSSLSLMAMVLYYVFLLSSAAFGLFGYFEIKAVGTGRTSAIFQLLSVVFLFVLFLFIPGREGNTQFGVFYGIFATFIPITLTILALINRRVSSWRAIIPLAIPVTSLIAYLLISSGSFQFGAWLLPFSWTLLGKAARGRD